MDIKVLGTGCTKCKKLEKDVRAIVEETKMDATITKIEDIMEIMQYGVMSTPAIVIDEKVVVSGRIPSTKELQELIKNK